MYHAPSDATAVTSDISASKSGGIRAHLQAYLISLYMDCPPGMGLHCPSAEKRAAVEAAIRKGVITWHAFPHNAQVQCLFPDH